MNVRWDECEGLEKRIERLSFAADEGKPAVKKELMDRYETLKEAFGPTVEAFYPRSGEYRMMITSLNDTKKEIYRRFMKNMDLYY